MITCSDKARLKISEIVKQDNLTQNHFLRVGVKSGGCSGLSYELAFDDQLKEGDQVFEDNGVKIVCDKRSFLYLFGTELDYSDGLNGKGFEFKNPNASRTCSCGESFAV